MAALRRRRLPFLALAMVTLVTALWGGLLRLHWHLPVPHANWISYHGPLMVSGFLGTVIGLERAVAMARWPAYAAPLLTGIGALALVVGIPYPAGPALMALGAGGLVAVFALFLRRQPTLFTLTMGAGAMVWLVGDLLWLARWEVPDLVPWWMGFLILTITGERLELTRFLPPTPGRRGLFLIAAGVLLTGLVASAFRPAIGLRLMGVGMAGLAAWAIRYDVARRTVRQHGLPRFVAVCLLSGYGWLALSGLLAVVNGPHRSGLLYDAQLHSLFAGFAFAMIFGHAPIIFPAVLGVPVTFHPRFYLHLALLHASLLARVAGDLGGGFPLRQWGGLGNAAAILLFLANTLSAIERPRPAPAT